MTETHEDVLISRMKHALGFGKRRPYTRHGRRFFKPYRNYYACYEDDLMEEAVQNGLLIKEKGDSLIYYYVSEKGRQWLGDKIGITIKDVER